MALQTTGPISWDQIRAQFGGTYPIYASQYYAGGPYVPAGTTGINGAIPASGPISPWHFYGAPAIPTGLVDLFPTTVYATGSAPVGTYARIGFDQSREWSTVGQQARQVVGTWLLSGLATDYELRATLVADNGQAGWVGGVVWNTWIPMGGLYFEYGYGNGGIGSQARATILFEMRLASTQQILDSAYVDLWSDRV